MCLALVVFAAIPLLVLAPWSAAEGRSEAGRPAPAHARSFNSAQATTTTVACDDSAHLYEGCTLSLTGPRWTNTGQALSYSADARAAVCTTTISGAKYVSTGYPASSRWRKAIDGFFLADFLTQPTQDAAWLMVHDALFATTVSGSKYCANRAKYAGGKWDQAFATVATLEAYLQQNPLVTAPPKPTASGSVTVTTDSTTWTQCATEGNRCAFTGTKQVRYGLGSTWTAPRAFTDGVACTNAVFGDPLVGTVKVCQTQ